MKREIIELIESEKGSQTLGEIVVIHIPNKRLISEYLNNSYQVN